MARSTGPKEEGQLTGTLRLRRPSAGVSFPCAGRRGESAGSCSRKVIRQSSNGRQLTTRGRIRRRSRIAHFPGPMGRSCGRHIDGRGSRCLCLESACEMHARAWSSKHTQLYQIPEDVEQRRNQVRSRNEKEPDTGAAKRYARPWNRLLIWPRYQLIS